MRDEPHNPGVGASGEADLPDMAEAAFESNSAVMLLVDPGPGTIIHANEAASNYSGRSRHEMRGMPTHEFVGMAPEELASLLAEVMAGRRTSFEYEHRLPDGELRRATVLCAPVRSGQRVLVSLVLMDCPERPRIEAALRASEERFRLLVETSTDVIWTVDEAMRFTYVSPAVMRLRGLTPEEAMRESLEEAVCPEFLPPVADSLHGRSEHGDRGETSHVGRWEIQQPHKDGSRVWVELITRELYDENGRRSGVLGISRDITRRKNAERQLLDYQGRLEAQNRELRRFKVAFEQSGNTIVITDPEGTILYANPRFEATTGYTLEEAKGQNPRILKSGELDDAAYRALWETISSGRIWRGEFHNRRKDGSLYWEAATIAPVVDEEGRITNYIAIKEDITVRKEAQESLRKYAVELESQNAELDAFAHTVAHDLKGPVGALVGFSELLADSPEMREEERSGMLNHINQTGWQMTRIIDALLLLSATRRKKVEIAPLDMGRIIAGVRHRLDNMVQQHGADIVEPESWPRALGYGPWVEEVWVNYLSNAVKYGGRPPRIELGAEATAEGTVRFWVRDNGAGLSPAEQSRLFLPFTRLHQVSVEGHGLGLSIVCRIVERLGGETGVESGVGEGSLFFFTLPQAAEVIPGLPPGPDRLDAVP
ncbi:PAS domain S-box protein [Candidatus Fermentibacteria bacterium]|nr:PAS domain S-box protein [Candidatus Fermentibacteria bacterium]